MNKLIVAGDSISAAVKVALAVGAVYVTYKAYRFSQDIKGQADQIAADIESAKQSSTEFVTETINPASKENAINKSVGEYTQPVFFKIFDFFGVGEK